MPVKSTHPAGSYHRLMVGGQFTIRPFRGKIRGRDGRPRSVKAMKRGDVYMAGLDPVIGSEQGGTRPVVIIQNNTGNLHAPTVIAVPVTSSTGKPPLPTHALLPAGEGGLWRDSIALCEQVRTLEKARLTRRLGAVSADALRGIEKALQVSLDINGEG